MIDDYTDEQLATGRIAWLSTVHPDGSPHTVPVRYVHDGSGFWIASSPTSRKVTNIQLNDQVSVAIDGSAAAPLVAQARAEVVGDPAQHPDAVTAFARKYGGFDITAESYAGRPVLVRLTIGRWLLDGSPA